MSGRKQFATTSSFCMTIGLALAAVEASAQDAITRVSVDSNGGESDGWCYFDSPTSISADHTVARDHHSRAPIAFVVMPAPVGTMSRPFTRVGLI